MSYIYKIYNDVSVKHNKPLLFFFIVLGQHVSIIIESFSGPSKKIDPYLEMLKCAVVSQTLTFLIKLCIKCMCRFVRIVQSGYLFLKL